MALADQQRKIRGELVAQRTSEARTLASLQIEKAKMEGDRKTVEADLGPVRYLATLLGAGDRDVLRWFTLVVALLLDPAPAALLLPATIKNDTTVGSKTKPRPLGETATQGRGA